MNLFKFLYLLPLKRYNNRKIYKEDFLWIIMTNKNLKRKLGVYGANFVARPVGNLIKSGSNIGNPIGAIVYGGLDILRNAIPSLKNNKYIRLFEAGGFAVYGLKTVGNLLSIAKGNYHDLAELPFNALMAYETGKNTLEDYAGKDIINDVKQIPQDFENITQNLNSKLN